MPQFASDRVPGVVLRDVRYAPARVQRRHCHARSSISLIVAGRVEETHHRDTRQGAEGTLIVKPAGAEHADRFGPRGAQVLQILFDDDAAAGASEGCVTPADYRWIEGGPAAACAFRLLAAVRRCDPRLALVLEDCLCQMAGWLTADGPAADGRRPPRWLVRVREQLDAATQAPRVADLAREANVHPVYLARSFRRAYGCSISDYTRRRRVGEACRRIAAGHDGLAELALDTGFADQPHLCRLFKAEMGISPGTFRRLLRSA